jgi:hypothetical protein
MLKILLIVVALVIAVVTWFFWPEEMDDTEGDCDDHRHYHE